MSFTVLRFIDYNIQRENYLVACVLYLSGLLKHDSKTYYCFDLLDTNLNVLMSQGKIIKQQDFYDFKHVGNILKNLKTGTKNHLLRSVILIQRSCFVLFFPITYSRESVMSLKNLCLQKELEYKSPCAIKMFDLNKKQDQLPKPKIQHDRQNKCCMCTVRFCRQEIY